MTSNRSNANLPRDIVVSAFVSVASAPWFLCMRLPASEGAAMEKGDTETVRISHMSRARCLIISFHVFFANYIIIILFCCVLCRCAAASNPAAPGPGGPVEGPGWGALSGGPVRVGGPAQNILPRAPHIFNSALASVRATALHATWPF